MAEHAVRGSEGCAILTMKHCQKYILHPSFERSSIGQKGFDSPESLIIGCCSRWKDSEHRRPKNHMMACDKLTLDDMPIRQNGGYPSV